MRYLIQWKLLFFVSFFSYTMDVPKLDIPKLKTTQEAYDAVGALAMGGGGDGVLIIHRDALRHLKEKLLDDSYVIPKHYLVVLINKGLVKEKTSGGCLKSQKKKYVISKYVTEEMINTSRPNTDSVARETDSLPDSKSSSISEP